MSSKEQKTSLMPNLEQESLDPDIYSSMDDDELVEFLKQQLVQEQEGQSQQTTTNTSGGGRRRSKRQAPVLETDEGKTLKDYILKLKKYSKNFNAEEKAVFKAQTGFKDKNITFDAICTTTIK